MKTLAISGSLRASSSNTSMLRAAAALAPSGIEFTLFQGIGNLPHFNPDLDDETVSPLVEDFRIALRTADAVIFSVPEYAHGVPGVLKNALDWVVGSGELAGKPVVLFNPSARGTYAQASLSETLSVMAAKIVPEASITLQVPGMAISAELIQQDADMSAKLTDAFEALSRFVEAQHKKGDIVIVVQTQSTN